MLKRFFPSSLISRIAVALRPALPDRAGLAIVLVVRNEARHIAEWADFHRRAGVAHIYTYDDGSTDGTPDILRATLGDQVTITPWHQRLRDADLGTEIHNQVLAYAHAVSNYGPRHRWMAPIDADEFLIPTQAHNLDAALAPLADCPAISLPWHNFGRNGHDAPPAGGVLANYTMRAANPLSGARGVTNFKTVFDPARIRALHVHSVETDLGRDVFNDAGRRFALRDRTTPAFYSTDAIQLNHYYTRSEQELAAKIARGSNKSVAADKHARRVRRNVANIEADQVADTTAQTFLARIAP